MYVCAFVLKMSVSNKTKLESKVHYVQFILFYFLIIPDIKGSISPLGVQDSSKLIARPIFIIININVFSFESSKFNKYTHIYSHETLCVQ